MAVYPLMLNLTDRLCVVVGGGPVAVRKVTGLLAAGARVRVVAPQLDAAFAALPTVESCARPFAPDDLDGAVLAFAATDSAAVNAAVAAAAATRAIPCNRADLIGGGDFAVPAVLRRGELTIAVASAGGSPLLAALLRDRLAAACGDEWRLVAEIAAALRRKELTGSGGSAYNREVILSLLTSGLPQLIASGDGAAADRLLQSVCGRDITLAALGVDLPKGTR